MKELSAVKRLDIRFSEVDSMDVVWHGAYPLYFEDAREEFGKKYGLGYMTIFANGYFAPIVELNFKYKKPLRYEMKPLIRITYRYSESAKIIFDYEIADDEGTIYATGSSTQVFMDRNYNLIWENPEFYLSWKNKWLGQE